MRKIEGLKFLQKYFQSVCVDCVFVTKEKPLNINVLEEHSAQLFFVRAARSKGLERGAPYKACRSANEVKDFIDAVHSADSAWDFVIHRVDKLYYEVVFIGTIALYEEALPMMVIDFQVVPKHAMLALAEGKTIVKRPRDWEVAATYMYRYHRLKPELSINDPLFSTGLMNGHLFQLWRIGRKIDSIKRLLKSQDSMALAESVTRFNIYPNGVILLDDHRNLKAFV